uniref:Catechol 2,3-dioxygenase n=1 Tax=Candidatus Kentrum sp. FM TaxID=2126340 RepID=A0A450SR92_9GAMM|nr:MAG: Catechol 2,3-dioxygenase [Candidatus Kentron sp. FM]VFJ56586.1 MAG: Catechol 2,3-dioxygenase [Candidatus Kentron sp. FM]VFK11312.1 MAG: Catechol 2,3-dioxygenase [Candidatus Kentron sp. FM]
MTQAARFEFLHPGISVTDIERTMDWYTRHFGFKVTKQFEKEELEIKGAVLELDGFTLEVLAPFEPKVREKTQGPLSHHLRNTGTNHLALATDDIAGCFERFQREGIEIVSPLLDGRLFFCKDPDQTLIEIKQK